MSKIRSKNTRPELLVRKFLFANGFRYRLHSKTLPGKPDIVLSKFKIAVFIHGCFWHGHKNCRYFVVPKTKTQWWIDKIEKNQANDAKNIALLKKMGWKIILIWECEIKPKTREKNLLKLLSALNSHRDTAKD